MNLLLEDDMHGIRPACWNRPPANRVRVRHGIDSETGEPIAVTVRDDWSDPVCRVWDGTGIGPNNERYPVAHGWNCHGCRSLPEWVK